MDYSTFNMDIVKLFPHVKLFPKPPEKLIMFANWRLYEANTGTARRKDQGITQVARIVSK